MTEIEAMQRALAGEHAVIFGYDMVGAKVPAPLQPTVQAAQQTHENRRDTLAARLRQRGAQPVAAEAAYRLPLAVTGEHSALTLARTLENRCAAQWRFVLASSADRSVRSLAAAALSAGAVQATRWSIRLGSPETQAFPGGGR